MSRLRFTVMIPPSPSSVMCVCESITHRKQAWYLTLLLSHSFGSLYGKRKESRAVPGASVPKDKPCVALHLSLVLLLTHTAKLLEQTCIMRRRKNKQGKEACI